MRENTLHNIFECTRVNVCVCVCVYVSVSVCVYVCMCFTYECMEANSHHKNDKPLLHYISGRDTLLHCNTSSALEQLLCLRLFGDHFGTSLLSGWHFQYLPLPKLAYIFIALL